MILISDMKEKHSKSEEMERLITSYHFHDGIRYSCGLGIRQAWTRLGKSGRKSTKKNDNLYYLFPLDW